ncbi:MAG: hypothetical protein LBE57_05055 [Methanosarcinales archaeon]|jgi:hypothetical protein|nr:hypothetical protein [Methanosarcinales archaeon]
MNSNEGTKVKYNVNQSEGQLYGLPGCEIDSSSKAFSLDEGKFFVLEARNSIGRHFPIISSWDISTGKRYPSDADSIHGNILKRINENEILVAELDSESIVHTVSTYNKKMKKISSTEPVIKWKMLYGDSKYSMFNIDVLKKMFPKLSEISDIPYYTTVVKSIEANFDIEDGDVLIFPIQIKEKKKEMEFPRISPLKHTNTKKPKWISVEAIIGTLSYGEIINPQEITLELVTDDEDND